MTSTLEVDLHKATEKTSWLIDTEALTIQEEIGKGRFGTVYKGTMLGSTVAVKALFGPSLDTEVTGSRSGPEDRVQVEQELLAMSQLSHATIVQFFGYAETTPATFAKKSGKTKKTKEEQGGEEQEGDEEELASGEGGGGGGLSGDLPDLAIVMEFMPMGSVEHYFHAHDSILFGGVPTNLRYRWATQVASALAYLHSRKPQLMIHGAVKPANFLLSQSLQCKLGDFGVAKLAEPSSASSSVPEEDDQPLSPTMTPRGVHGGSVRYMPPEVREHQPATTKSDLYSMGMSMCFLFEGAPPQVEGITDATKHFEALKAGKLPKLKHAPPDVKKLISSCLAVDPEKRPCASDLLTLLRAAKQASKKRWLFFSGRPSPQDAEAVESIYTSLGQSLEGDVVATATAE